MSTNWSRKRKHQYTSPVMVSSVRIENEDTHDTYDSLVIQAHEADLVHHRADVARSLEAGQAGQPSSSLIKLEWQVDGDDVWVDRYDVRLLLDAPPPQGDPRPPSPAGSGWSELPSDSEDTFFFGPGEALEDYRREKRRKLMDHDREERLRALRDEEGGGDEEQDEEWGGSDEEPDGPQRELMQRTAKHIISSPNPTQLEMRIIANHGADKRFAFLRGRWRRAWGIEKQKARMDSAAKSSNKLTAPVLGGLAGYGESDDDSNGTEIDGEADKHLGDEVEQDEREGGQNGVRSLRDSEAQPPAVSDAVMEARRMRAREWAEKRRAVNDAKDASVS